MSEPDHHTSPGRDAVEILHRPLERDHVAAIVAHHAFRDARRARRIENVERVGGGDRHALAGLGVVDRVLPHRAPVMVAARRQLRLALRALQDHAGRRLVLRKIDRLVEQRLVGHDARALDAAAGGQDDLRLGVVDAGGELLGGEAAEHHRVDGADARAGEHGEHRLRHHRHIDDDAVALLDAEVAQDGAEQLHLGQHAAVGEGLHRVGDGGIVDQRGLVVAAARARGGRARCSRCCRWRRRTSGRRCRHSCRRSSSASRTSRCRRRPRPRTPPGCAASARRRRDSGWCGRPSPPPCSCSLRRLWNAGAAQTRLTPAAAPGFDRAQNPPSPLRLVCRRDRHY